MQVEGKSIKTTTDTGGRYLLLGVPNGQVKVTVSYLGLESSTNEVTVSAGTTASQDFALAPAKLSTSVTVTDSPDLVGQARALNDQQNSINLVNLVASDQIGSFPDPHAAEATQRIPGIVVQRDQGEGRYVLIRGTEPRLSATTINGERIGTTENTSRQIPLDTIPADLMGAIEVTKALTPDMEADSIGGRINLITKRAPTRRHTSLTLASGFNTLVKDDIKDFNGTFGQRLLQDKLGFIVSANFYQNNRGSQDQEPSYTSPSVLANLDLRDYVLTRTRKGGTWDLDYRLAPGSEIFFRGLRTEYEDSELRHRFRDLVSNSRLERLLRDRYHDSNQTALSAGGTHTLPSSWLLSWRAAYSKALLDTPYRLESTFRQTGVTFAPNTLNGIDPNNIQPNPQNQNLNNFNFIQNSIQNDHGYERNLSGGFDLSAPTRIGTWNGGLLKFGLKVRDANRTRDVGTITQTPRSGTTIKLLDNIDPDYSPADNYLGGKYQEFGQEFPDVDKMRSLSHGGLLATVVSPTGDSGSYRAKERVTGGYVMEQIFLGEGTSILPGIRFEATNTTYGAPQYLLSGSTVLSRTVLSGNNDYLNIMPGVHFRHELAANTPLRISFTRSLARPNYNDLAPFLLQDPTALTVSKGNPNLKVTTSNNVDVALEHYFQNVGIASGGFFYKNLDHYIYATTLQQNIGSDLYRISQPVNGDEANLYGVEFTLVRQLDFLPGMLRGFTTYANYTHVHSNAKMPRGDFILPGQASDMANGSLAYERGRLFARMSFNYQGHYILALGNTTADDNWLDNRLEIDFSGSYRITRHVRVFIDMLNLGNEPYRVYAGDTSHPIQEERYKIWAITGLKLDF